jgi:hypothetical protein
MSSISDSVCSIDFANGDKCICEGVGDGDGDRNGKLDAVVASSKRSMLNVLLLLLSEHILNKCLFLLLVELELPVVIFSFESELTSLKS